MALHWQNSLKAMMTKTSTIIKLYKLYKMTVTLKKFAKMRCQFLQSLNDNFEQRFPADDFLQAVSCLNPQMWPQDPLKRALFGDDLWRS